MMLFSRKVLLLRSLNITTYTLQLSYLGFRSDSLENGLQHIIMEMLMILVN